MTKHVDITKCGFCGKPRREVRHLIQGPQICICDECVELSVDIIAEDEARTPMTTESVMCDPPGVD